MADDIKTLERFINRFGNVIAKNAKRIERVAITTTYGLYLRRIFNDGKATDGSKIGQYSTNPTLIGAQSFRTRSQANKVLGSKKKRSALSWVKAKGNNLVVLKGGYKELRSLQGLQTSTVNLQYRDDLFRSVKIGTNKGDTVIGFVDGRGLKGKADLQRKKAEGNEARFGKQIFTISKSEQKAMDLAVIKEVDAIIRKL